MRREITKLRAEAASFRPSRKEPKRLPPISVPVPTPKEALKQEPISMELDEYMRIDTELLKELGWTKFVQHLRSRSDFASLDEVHHPARRLLNFYKYRGAPVKLGKVVYGALDVRESACRPQQRSPQVVFRIQGVP